MGRDRRRAGIILGPKGGAEIPGAGFSKKVVPQEELSAEARVPGLSSGGPYVCE